MGNSLIPYCDKVLDVSLGCRKRSPGCDHCWALGVVNRMVHNPSLPKVNRSLVRRNGGWLGWGELGGSYQWLGERLAQLRTRKPAFWFLNSKSDLLDERASFADLALLFDTIAETHWHRYMVLTKEPGRLAAFLGSYENEGRHEWPRDFPHVILMTSIESAEYMSRWDTLAAIPAAHRGISFEPLLEPVAPELKKRLLEADCAHYDATDRSQGRQGCIRPENASGKCAPGWCVFGRVQPDWVVVGCEQLPGHRAGRWAGEEPDAWWGAAALIVQTCLRAASPPWVWMKQGPIRRGGRIEVTSDLDEFPETCRAQEYPWADWRSEATRPRRRRE